MELREIFRFEFAYQLRRLSTWLLFAVLVVFAFLNTRDDSVAEALYEDFFLNSPFAVAQTTVVGTLMWLLVAAVVAGRAAARDVETGMHPLTYTAPVRKTDYLGGRFLAALVLNALLLLAVQAGVILAVYWPGVHPDRTPTEMRWLLLALEGGVLWNRLLWLGIGVAALAVTYLRFRFAHRTQKRRWWRRRRYGDVVKGGGGMTNLHITVSNPPISFGFAIQARQTLALAWSSFRTTMASRVGLALLAGFPLLAFAAIRIRMVSGGVPRIPTTALVLSELTTPLSTKPLSSAELSGWVIIPLLLVFFAGELVWRERDAGVGELTDATPTSEWPPLLGKFVGLGLVLAVFMALLAAGGMLAQASLGYRDFEIGLYLKALFGLQLPEYLLFALLVLVVHVLVNQKYIGHLAAIVTYAFIVMPSLFGIEHNLLVYGAGPGSTPSSGRSSPATRCGSSSWYTSSRTASAESASTARWWPTAPSSRTRIGCRPSGTSRGASSRAPVTGGSTGSLGVPWSPRSTTPRRG